MTKIDVRTINASELKYVDVHDPITDEELVKMLNSNNITDICRGIVRTCMYGEYDFAIQVCRNFYNHKDVDVRRNVVNGLYHISYNYLKIDLELANNILNNALDDTDMIFKGEADDAIDDLKRNIKQFKFIRNKISKYNNREV